MKTKSMLNISRQLVSQVSNLQCRKMGWMSSPEWRWWICFTDISPRLLPIRIPNDIFESIQEEVELHREDNPHQTFFLTQLTRGCESLTLSVAQ